MFFGENENNNNGRNSAGGGVDIEGYFMGRHSYGSNGSGNGIDEYKEQAAKIAGKVQEQAKVLKDKALDWFASLTQQ